MRVIGLTGGIGSGKSTVAAMLVQLGASLIDADKVGHRVMENAETISELTARFGSDILTVDGTVDRSRLGAIVFNDSRKLAELNNIMHPRMDGVTDAMLEELRQRGVPVAVLEATLLVESGWIQKVDTVWVTMAPEEVVIERLEKRSGLSAQESLDRIHSQMAAGERRRFADVVIDTNCSLDALRDRVAALWKNERAAAGDTG